MKKIFIMFMFVLSFLIKVDNVQAYNSCIDLRNIFSKYLSDENLKISGSEVKIFTQLTEPGLPSVVYTYFDAAKSNSCGGVDAYTLLSYSGTYNPFPSSSFITQRKKNEIGEGWIDSFLWNLGRINGSYLSFNKIINKGYTWEKNGIYAEAPDYENKPIVFGIDYDRLDLTVYPDPDPDPDPVVQYYNVYYKPNTNDSVDDMPVDSTNISNDEDIYIASSVPQRTGWTFLGWNIDPNATVASHQAGMLYQDRKDLILYAIWQKNPDPVVQYYNVYYRPNTDDSVDDMPADSTDIPNNEDVYIASSVPQRAGWTFLGWNTDQNATVVSHQVGMLCQDRTDLTLYAIWQKNSDPNPNPVIPGPADPDPNKKPPVLNFDDVTSDKVRLKVSNAGSSKTCIIYRAEENGLYHLMNVMSCSEEYVDESLKSNTTYHYQVFVKGDSVSPVFTIKTLEAPPTVEENKKIPYVEISSVESNQIKISVKNANIGEMCDIYKSIEGSSYKLIKTIHCNEEFIDKSIVENTIYSYRVSSGSDIMSPEVGVRSLKKASSNQETVKNPETGIFRYGLGILCTLLVGAILLYFLNQNKVFRKIR